MASKPSLNDFKPFFGGDPKGAFLVQAMFNGTNYTDKVDQSSLMTELLRADNYKNTKSVRASSNGQGQGPDDVHQDVTDLLITTALFHKLIDQSAMAGTGFREFADELSKVMLNSLNDPIPANPQVEVYATTATQPNRTIGSVFVPLTRLNHIVYMLMDRAVFEAQVGTANSTSLSAFMDHYNRTSHYAINLSINTGNAPNDTIIKTGFANNDVITKLTQLTTNSTNPPGAIREIKNEISREIVNGFINVALAMRAELRAMYPGLSAQMITIPNPAAAAAAAAPPMITIALKSTDIAPDNIDGHRSVLTIRRFLSQHEQKYIAMIKDEIKRRIPMALNSVFSRNSTIFGTNIRHTTLNTTTAKNFFDAVYKSWPSMSPDIRKFYGQNISIFAKRGSSFIDPIHDPHRRPQDLTDWIRLSPNEIDALFNNNRILTSAELQQLRVNLMKDTQSGLKEVLFGSNLPNVSAGCNVWYTQTNGTVDFVVAPQMDFLRKLYSSTYELPQAVIANGIIPVTYTTQVTRPAVMIGAVVAPLAVVNTVQLINVEINFDLRPKNKEFDLDLGKFTAAAIKREDDRINKDVGGKTAKFDDRLDVYPFLTAYDNVYGKLWTFDPDKNEYYRLDLNSNRKIYYGDEAKGDTKTCYATYLGGKDPSTKDGKCLRVIQCIANGDSKSLARCLDVLEEADLWDVAITDVTAVGPDMVKLVLRKFGVKGYNKPGPDGVSIRVPMSYNEWMTKIVVEFDPSVRAAIMGNDRLKTYIKGLIGVCTSSPSVLNKHIPAVVARDNTPDYIKNLNMKKYKIPSVNKQTQYEFFAEQLRNAVQPHAVDAGWFNPITSGNFSNVSFMNPFASALPTMFGGGPAFFTAINPSLPSSGTGVSTMDRQNNILKQGSANMFTHLLGTIQNALADSGMHLLPEDLSRINGTIKKLVEYENQLARMCSVLISIVKIARFFGVSLENVDKDNLSPIPLKDIATLDDIRTFVRCHARKLTQNMMTNMSIQQSAAYELMNRVGPRLLDDCTDRRTEPCDLYTGEASSGTLVDI